MQNLKGKRIVVTGGSQGLGLAMVEVLAASGAHVTAIARDRLEVCGGRAGRRSSLSLVMQPTPR